ncbi:MAG: O-antigen ligase family protein [bacterium]|nr:O-antigen ligase family protein [bacterium]
MPKSRSILLGPWFALLVAIGASLLTWLGLSFLGMKYFTIALGGSAFLLFFVWYSTRDISFSIALWLFSMSGFKSSTLIMMPGIPDFSFDRLLIIWIVMWFLVKSVMHGVRARKPFAADILIVLHTAYILHLATTTNMPYFHAWVYSSLSPLAGYLYGRFVLTKESEYRNLAIFILFITLWYAITSIAEHMGWHALVWPKTILDPHAGHLWHPGRSRGPIMHPPLFGQLFAMFFLVHFYFLSRPLRNSVRVLMVLSLALSLLGLFFTYTRAPWIATGAAIAVMAVLRPNYRKIVGVMAVIGVLAGITGALKLADSEFLRERLNSDNTFENRLSMLATSLRIIRDYPVTGVGYFKSKDQLWRYNQGVQVPFYGFVKKSMGQDLVPHDIYLGRSADEGLLSIGILIAFSVLIARAFLKLWQANPDHQWFNRDYLAVIAGIFVCYLVGGMGIDFRYFDLVNVVPYMFAGAIYRLGHDPDSLMASSIKST